MSPGGKSTCHEWESMPHDGESVSHERECMYPEAQSVSCERESMSSGEQSAPRGYGSHSRCSADHMYGISADHETGRIESVML